MKKIELPEIKSEDIELPSTGEPLEDVNSAIQLAIQCTKSFKCE